MFTIKALQRIPKEAEDSADKFASRVAEDYAKVIDNKILEELTKENFEKYFKSPFRCDEWGGYVWDSENNMVLSDVKTIPMYILEDLVNVMNYKDEDGSITDIEFYSDNNDAYFTINKEYQLDIRGWGYLTGRCKLSPENAAKIQDSFGQWVLSLFGK